MHVSPRLFFYATASILIVSGAPTPAQDDISPHAYDGEQRGSGFGHHPELQGTWQPAQGLHPYYTQNPTNQPWSVPQAAPSYYQGYGNYGPQYHPFTYFPQGYYPGPYYVYPHNQPQLSQASWMHPPFPQYNGDTPSNQLQQGSGNQSQDWNRPQHIGQNAPSERLPNGGRKPEDSLDKAALSLPLLTPVQVSTWDMGTEIFVKSWKITDLCSSRGGLAVAGSVTGLWCIRVGFLSFQHTDTDGKTTCYRYYEYNVRQTISALGSGTCRVPLKNIPKKTREMTMPIFHWQIIR